VTRTSRGFAPPPRPCRDYDLTDDEYDKFLDLLTVDELRLEAAERQRRDSQHMEGVLSATNELLASFVDARARFVVTPGDLPDWLNYGAHKIVAHERFHEAMVLLQEDLDEAT
jgi:hypothetical protein